MPGNELKGWVENWLPDTLWRNTRPVPRDALPLLYAVTEHRAWAKDVEAAAGIGKVVEAVDGREPREVEAIARSLVSLFEQYVKTNRKLPPELMHT